MSHAQVKRDLMHLSDGTYQVGHDLFWIHEFFFLLQLSYDGELSFHM